MPSTTLEYALHYAGLGWRVFPLTPGTNVPLKGTNGHKEATTHESQLTDWWATHPDRNIGIATGAVSGIWVLDLDVKDGKDGPKEVQRFMEREKIEPPPLVTLRAKSSSGGKHLVFKYDATKPVGNRAAVFGPGSGVDIRGNGGYICAAPSLRGQGLYKWVDPLDTPVSASPDWANALYAHDYRSGGVRSEGSTKVDKSNKLPWDMALDFRHRNTTTINETEVGNKYIVRCPFHDDRSASAAFWRKTPTFGYLYCSACDTTWTTEPKRMSRQRAMDINQQISHINALLKEKQ